MPAAQLCADHALLIAYRSFFLVVPRVIGENPPRWPPIRAVQRGEDAEPKTIVTWNRNYPLEACHDSRPKSSRRSSSSW